MPTFSYTVLGKPGERLSGSLDAENHSNALQELDRRGYHVLDLEETKTRKFGLKTRLSTKQVTYITRQLGSLTSAGVPLLRALRLLEEQAEKLNAREVLKGLREAVNGGSTFSEALARYDRSFNPLYINLVHAGETGGMLEEVLKRLARHMEAELEVRSRVRSALAYPLLMLMVGFITVFVLLSFVIPRITGLFTEVGRSLPLPTLALISVSRFFRDYWSGLALGIIALAIVMKVSISKPKGRLLADKVALKIPLIGSLILKTETGRFCRVLGTLLGNGVHMLQALSITGTTLGNRLLGYEVEQMTASVRQGESLSQQMTARPVFPRILTEVTMVGEQSGELDKALEGLAEQYDGEIERAIRTMLSLMEPLMIIGVGSVVGFIVLALLLPIFDLNEVVQ